jgi:uncharacterized protein (DUF1015 family)
MLKPQMAQVHPFRAYRYTKQAGDLKDLVTQPYDKITREMQTRYLERSPHNLVRVILGQKTPTDDALNNVYTRARDHFEQWISDGLIAQDPEPAFYAYYQQFVVPETGERLTRKGFIGLGDVVPYEDRVVHRHEQTLSGPKKDRREVLEHTKAHFGQIFMLYEDPAKAIDGMLDGFCREPLCDEVPEEDGTLHRIYRITDAEVIERIRSVMSDKKLIIADGHHRYETALAYRNDHPEMEDAKRVMMTFVNLHSDGLRILATHRVLAGVDDLNPEKFLESARREFTVSKLEGPAALKQIFGELAPDKIRIGVMFHGSLQIHLLERARKGDLDVRVLHQELLGKALGIDEEAVRNEKHLRYVRGLENATDMVKAGEAQAAFLLEPTSLRQVADTSLAGGVMPQKSTDFYPKLLSGMTMYRLEH